MIGLVLNYGIHSGGDDLRKDNNFTLFKLLFVCFDS